MDARGEFCPHPAANILGERFKGKLKMVLLKKSNLYLCLLLACAFLAAAAAQSSAPTGVAIGTVKSISGNSIVLTTDAGDSVNVSVQDGARLRRIAPGETDLQKASPLSLTDLQAGDRVRVRGTTGADKTILAVSVIAIKKEDVAQRQQKDLQDWNRRGAGGLVKSVDAANNTVTISVSSLGTSKDLVIKAAADTRIRRYSDDSIKFDDARPSQLSVIKAGDQLRARGTRNPDGTQLAAEEIVFGSFRNVAGLVTAVDAEKNEVTVNDLTTKKPVTIRITKDSQMHKLPQMAAMLIAARLKGIPLPGAAGAAMAGGGNPNAGNGAAQGAPQAQRGNAPDGARPQGQPAGQGQGQRGADLQQMLNRMPVLQVSEIQKGDAVMIVATEGSATSQPTAVNLIGGVEPILTAAPNGMGAAASLLSPWNLGAGGPDAGGGN